MNTELIRTELQRLLRQTPYQRFLVTYVGGEIALIDHPENVAFDPRPGMSSDFYVITGGLRMFSTFDKVSSLSLLTGGTVIGESVSG